MSGELDILCEESFFGSPKKEGSEVDHLGLGSETGTVLLLLLILFIAAVIEPSHIQREGNRPLFSR